MPALCVAMVVILVGIILLLNPLSMLGFGALGPIAGSFAALWQAYIGNVIAGSLFAILQSAGMVYGWAISLTGGIIAVLGAVAAWFM